MTVLAGLVAGARQDLQRRRALWPDGAVQAAAQRRAPARDFGAALRGRGIGLIAEVKRASPSRGVIKADVDPAEMARAYAAAGVNAVSVLTEERRFGGGVEHLSAVVEALEASGPPVMRKDFIVDPYQVYEARACGADCVLLIAAVLGRCGLPQLLALARELGMQSLVEVHDESEVGIALDSGAFIIGINNRDLRTMEVDLATTERLRPRIPAGRLVVSESGIRSRHDMRRLAGSGIDAVLVGEALMCATDISAKVRELRCAAFG